MRTWGRVTDEFGNKTWVEVSTNAQGQNDYVYITALAQCLKGEYGESPFFGNYGIPAHLTVVTQVQPDYYVQQTQRQYAVFFAALTIGKLSANPPTYQVNIVTHAGVPIQFQVTGVPI